MNIQQQADQIIADEGITNEPIVPDEPTPDGEIAPVPVEENKEVVEDNKPTPLTTDLDKPEDKPDEPEVKEEVKEEPKDPDPKEDLTKVVEESRSMIENLNLTEDKIFDAEGKPRPFRDVVPAGEFLVSQLSPVKVVDKDGKTHEFLLLSDVEKVFPDGFEAKNNLEDMKFRSAIMENESAFKKAVAEYNSAEAQYSSEIGEIVSSRQSQAQTANEYKAMAEQGLVPKVDGDLNDPKNPAILELDKLLDFQRTKNIELAEKGLGQITSLWVAKQLMDSGVKQEVKEDKKKQIIDERKEVASLSSTPTSGASEQQQPVRRSTSLRNLAEEIIQEEGLI